MSEKKTYGSEMSVRERWKLYGEMTDLEEITRRYFVMNLFDGILTVLGIVMGSFILFLTTDYDPNRLAIVIQALATVIAIGISGITGGFLSERAERKRKIIELHRAMLKFDEGKVSTSFFMQDNPTYKIEDYYPIQPIKDFEEKQKGMSTVKIDLVPKLISTASTSAKKKEKTIVELAERYASFISSVINGVAPVVGGFIVVIPFLFIANPTWWIYVFSFVLIALLLFGLGVYLAKISKDSIWKYGIKMTLIGLLTAALTFLLSFLS